jgi:hypothetical protein
VTGPYTALTADEITAKLTGIRDARPIGNAKFRLMAWESCWGRNDTAPYFNRGNTHEHEQFVALRDSLFRKYFYGLTEIVEFGCGVGENLLSLPDRHLRGYDWSAAAVARCRSKGIEAEVFDMFNPGPVHLKGCGVFTVHAFEQLGENWHRMAFALRAAKPAVVVQIEPIYELYDPLDLNDFLAMKYHEARGYLKDYLPTLKDWHTFLDILEITKSPFGNIHHKAYSVLAWRPK